MQLTTVRSASVSPAPITTKHARAQGGAGAHMGIARPSKRTRAEKVPAVEPSRLYMHNHTKRTLLQLQRRYPGKVSPGFIEESFDHICRRNKSAQAQREASSSCRGGMCRASAPLTQAHPFPKPTPTRFLIFTFQSSALVASVGALARHAHCIAQTVRMGPVEAKGQPHHTPHFQALREAGTPDPTHSLSHYDLRQHLARALALSSALLCANSLEAPS
eukprot:scaffold44589_cov21-Tisochrysis_lutea.AAC.5